MLAFISFCVKLSRNVNVTTFLPVYIFHFQFRLLLLVSFFFDLVDTCDVMRENVPMYLYHAFGGDVLQDGRWTGDAAKVTIQHRKARQRRLSDAITLAFMVGNDIDGTSNIFFCGTFILLIFLFSICCMW